MTPFSIAFCMVNSLALLTLPRKVAPIPLLVGACYMTLGQGIEIGPFHFPVIRLLILAAVVRVILRKEYPRTKLNTLDKTMVAWSGWFALCSLFHKQPIDTLVFHLGLIYNTCGLYVLFRCFCRTIDDVVNVLRYLAIILVPVAVEMASEQFTNYNLFSVFGGVSEAPIVRNGRIRSQGPFGHPILAGTVGGVSFPLMLAIWKRAPLLALVGLAACSIIVLASASSGPIMSVVFGSFALLLWKFRHLTGKLRLAAVCIYILADLVMKDPAYFLLTRIDLTGSSSSYHRAALLQSAFEHIDEWWFAGTDYTRHWMPYGVSWSEDHCDITNHYLGQGVKGGLPLAALFVLMLAVSFSYVGKLTRDDTRMNTQDKFFAWAIGSSLFSHAATFMSVAYFDQSMLFLYLNIGAIASLRDQTTEGVESDLRFSDGHSSEHFESSATF